MFQQLLESEPTSQLKQLLESKTTFLVSLKAGGGIHVEYHCDQGDADGAYGQSLSVVDGHDEHGGLYACEALRDKTPVGQETRLPPALHFTVGFAEARVAPIQ